MTIDFAAVQSRLLAHGYAVGAVDGIAGTKTWAGVFAYVAQRQMAAMLPFGDAAKVYLPAYHIADTPMRAANFIGQAALESGCFRYMREIWGPTTAQRSYEGRRDLGNTQPGDGHRFMGRGIFQITGRANYDLIGQRIGIDLVDNPALAESPLVAVLTACDFWSLKKLNDLADTGQEDAITRRINGGTNGIDDRRKLVARAKELLS